MDMLAHWAIFAIGGRAGNGEGKVCHRCGCSYNDLGRIFTTYEVQKGDTPSSIAEAHGQSVEELRDNNPDDDYEYENELKFLDMQWACKDSDGCNRGCTCYFNERNLRLSSIADDADILAAVAQLPSAAAAIPGTSGQPQRKGKAKAARKSALPKKLLLRVHVQHAMDRELPSNALLSRVGVAAHLMSPICMQHGGMRVSEYFFKHIQEIVVKEGGQTIAKQGPAVARLNAILRSHGVSYQVKAINTSNGEKPGWYKAKFNGETAKKISATASYENEHGETVGWLWDLWKGTPRESGQDPWLHKMAATWEKWNEVLLEGRMLEPSPSVVNGFGAKCRTLYRYAPRRCWCGSRTAHVQRQVLPCHLHACHKRMEV